MKNFSIQKPISFSGVGLHSGVNTNITLKPSEENSGIFFNRTDLGKVIPARWDHVVSTKFSTNLGLNDIEVKTVEHLLFTSTFYLSSYYLDFLYLFHH